MDDTIPDVDSGAIEALEKRIAEDRVRWALERFGERLAMSTSFGIQSAVMLHLVTSIVPDIPVIFVDTGYLFPETYRFADQLKRRLELNLEIYNPRLTPAHQEALYGKRWEQGAEALEAYNEMNKVEPMNRAISDLGVRGWLSGIRRDQASSREDRTVVEKQNKIWKIYPIIDWSDRDIYQYLVAHDLPYHPLWEHGYASVGDWHSSSPLSAGMTEEATRFGGLKRECGLHDSGDRPDYQI